MISREGTKIAKSTKKGRNSFANFVFFVSSCETNFRLASRRWR